MEVSGDRPSTVPWEPWGVDGGKKVKANTSLELSHGEGAWALELWTGGELPRKREGP